ncbi:indolepyruvate oxidoreductase subunit beta family protein [Pseudonocardia asaccharolytica]|uniref:indolepyruvate oxidoreductase subunit beta family protein n=1 Tax=Pseudonocardia asaccharolytica TaxID=54010 RepID=UPI0003FB4A36|nr:indolepyruvate oxidoreductase subunit beta family protein [Pseudonocardia asaccharolytica]
MTRSLTGSASAGPSWYSGRRPLTLAILAMGGEGGGVLADWVVALAERAGHRAQSTSVAGVAQRTGATVYYVELFPPAGPDDGPAGGPADQGRPEPVLSLFPTPGEVDVVIASELMEAGRAVQRGFATPDRTTLIASTHRVYAIDEKMAPGDGRTDSAALLDGARRGSRRLVAADFADIAAQARSVISAALFGALAGAGVLPFDRERFEAQIRAFGKAVEPSLRAFAGGYAAAAEQPPPTPRNSQQAVVDIAIGPRPRTAEERKAEQEARRSRIAAADPAALVGPALRPLARRVGELPGAARSMALYGLVRTALYQDLGYAERYLQRVARIAGRDPDPDGTAALTTEAARHVGLWMCYQDTIQVAHQKVRAARMARIRTEAGAEPDQLVAVREFLHPQIDEITDTLPTRLGAALRRSRPFQRLVRAATGQGMILNTSSIVGYSLLTTMARARPLRPRSLRFGREQAAIEQWLDVAAAAEPDLACEILRCQGVLKGYGATYAHGNDSFAALLRAARALAGTPGAAATLAGLRAAALADEDGATLRARLAEAGLG